AGQVATGEQVRERARVRPRDLDDALDGDVPQRHVVHERPVLLDGVAVRIRVEHVLVDVVRGAAGAQGGVEEGRAAVPGTEVQGGACGRRQLISLGRWVDASCGPDQGVS